jgi:hypothetical protein
MNNDYIVNGKVARNRIALDIKYRKLNRISIERLISDPEIASTFFGGNFTKKTPKNEWNKSYLDELSYAAVAQSFNPDYLFYLDEVAEFVNKPESKKPINAYVVLIIAIVIAISIAITIAVHNKAEAAKKKNVNTEQYLELQNQNNYLEANP